MKIGIMSDSHDHMVLIRRAAETFRAARVAAVIHAGDILSPHAAQYLDGLDAPFHAVFGNNDFERGYLRSAFAAIGSIEEGPLTLVIDSVTFGVVHDDRRAFDLARRGGHDVIVYGHSHAADVHTLGSTLLLNPGEVCGWCSGRSTVALFDTRTRAVEIRDLVTPAA